MSKKQALGRGLEALLSSAPRRDTTSAPAQSVAAPAPPAEERPEVVAFMAGAISVVPVGSIEANPDQPRRDFDEEALQALADSIRELGIIQPITVQRVAAHRYRIISGERRFRAAQLAGLDRLPAYLREADDQTVLEMALVENIQRQDLHAIELAQSFHRLIEECGHTHDALGKRLGVDRSSITNHLRLLRLPADIQLAVSERRLGMGHARALVAVDDASRQRSIFQRILADDLSVRQVEELARPKARNPRGAGPVLTFDRQQVQADLRLKYGTRVALKPDTAGGGRIELPFRDNDELDRLLALLGL
jgi:ParB family chromosome partitioning protein